MAIDDDDATLDAEPPVRRTLRWDEHKIIAKCEHKKCVLADGVEFSGAFP